MRSAISLVPNVKTKYVKILRTLKQYSKSVLIKLFVQSQKFVYVSNGVFFKYNLSYCREAKGARF